MAYEGTVDLISGIRPKNGQDFALVNAKDVYVDDDHRLDDLLDGGVVRYDATQELTEEQKEQARENVAGASSQDIIDAFGNPYIDYVVSVNGSIVSSGDNIGEDTTSTEYSRIEYIDVHEFNSITLYLGGMQAYWYGYDLNYTHVEHHGWITTKSILDVTNCYYIRIVARVFNVHVSPTEEEVKFNIKIKRPIKNIFNIINSISEDTNDKIEGISSDIDIINESLGGGLLDYLITVGGSILIDDGGDATSPVYSRIEYIDVSKYDSVKIKLEKLGVYYYKYNGSKVSIGHSGWHYNDIVVDVSDTAFIRAVVRHPVSETQTSPTSLEITSDVVIEALAKSMTDEISAIKTLCNSQSISINQLFNNIEDLGAKIVKLEWAQGNLKVDGTDDNDSYYNSRIRSDYIDVSGYLWLSYKIAASFRVYIYTFDDSMNKISSISWVTNSSNKVDISSVSYVRFLFTKTADSITPYATFDEGNQNLTVGLLKYKSEDVVNLLNDSNKSAIAPNYIWHSLLTPPSSTRYMFAKGKMWEAYWNTIESYTLAGQDERCWCINGDVQYTSEDSLVMFHDQTVNYNGSSVAIRSLTDAQVESISIDYNGRSYSIATFEDFINICRTYGKVCCIELKGPSAAWSWTTNDKAELLDNIVNRLYELGMQDSTFICASNQDLIYIRDKYPSIPCCRLWDSNVTVTSINRFIDDPQVIPGGYPANWISNDTIKVAHAAGQKVLVYTTRPQTKTMIDDMKAIGADIISIYRDPDASD